MFVVKVRYGTLAMLAVVEALTNQVNPPSENRATRPVSSAASDCNRVHPSSRAQVQIAITLPSWAPSTGSCTQPRGAFRCSKNGSDVQTLGCSPVSLTSAVHLALVSHRPQCSSFCPIRPQPQHVAQKRQPNRNATSPDGKLVGEEQGSSVRLRV